MALSMRMPLRVYFSPTVSPSYFTLSIMVAVLEIAICFSPSLPEALVLIFGSVKLTVWPLSSISA